MERKRAWIVIDPENYHVWPRMKSLWGQTPGNSGDWPGKRGEAVPMKKISAPDAPPAPGFQETQPRSDQITLLAVVLDHVRHQGEE